MGFAEDSVKRLSRWVTSLTYWTSSDLCPACRGWRREKWFPVYKLGEGVSVGVGKKNVTSQVNSSLSHLLITK